MDTKVYDGVVIGGGPVRGAEPGEVPDRSHDRESHGRIDAGHGHQPQHLRAVQRGLPELDVDQAQLLGVEVELAQQRRRRGELIGGQLLLGEPGASLVPEQIRGRAARDQVPVREVCGQLG